MATAATRWLRGAAAAPFWAARHALTAPASSGILRAAKHTVAGGHGHHAVGDDHHPSDDEPDGPGVAKVQDMPDVLAHFKQARFVNHIGLELTAVRTGQAWTRLAVRPEFTQAEGYVHAGVLSTMADHTAGTAASTLIAPHQSVLTVEFKINLLRPAIGSHLRAVAKVIRAGRRMHIVNTRVLAEHNGRTRLVSFLTATIAVVDRPPSAPASPSSP